MKELEKVVSMKAEQVDGVETYAINFVAKEELLEPVCVGDFVRTKMLSLV